MKLKSMLLVTALASSMTFAQAETQPGAEAPQLIGAAPTTEPATQPSDPKADAEARQALEGYNAAVAAGDVAKVLSCFSFQSDLQRQAFGLMGEVSKASDALFQATQKQFGEASMGESGVGKDAFPQGFPQLPLERLQIRASGNQAALLSAEGEPLEMSLTKTDAGWKLDGSKLQSFTQEQFTQQKSIIDDLMKAMNETREDVPALNSPEEVVLLMNHRMEKAMRAAQIRQLEEQIKNSAQQEGGASTQPSGPPAPPSEPPAPME